MNHKNITTSLLALIAATLFTGCAAPRWKIYQSDYSYRTAVKEDEYHTQNTILVDGKTGKTWMLLPNDEEKLGYEWMELQKKSIEE